MPPLLREFCKVGVKVTGVNPSDGFMQGFVRYALFTGESDKPFVFENSHGSAYHHTKKEPPPARARNLLNQ